jgi:hypothetical protein
VVAPIAAGVAISGVAADAWTVAAACTCDRVAGDGVGVGAGAGVITPAAGLEAGVGVGVGLAEGDAGVPRAAPGTYHCRLSNATGSASRSSAGVTSLVVKASGPALPGKV